VRTTRFWNILHQVRSKYPSSGTMPYRNPSFVDCIDTWALYNANWNQIETHFQETVFGYFNKSSDSIGDLSRYDSCLGLMVLLLPKFSNYLAFQYFDFRFWSYLMKDIFHFKNTNNKKYKNVDIKFSAHDAFLEYPSSGTIKISFIRYDQNIPPSIMEINFVFRINFYYWNLQFINTAIIITSKVLLTQA
jgi:hypothetical protein